MKQKTAYIVGPYRADTIRGITENIRKAESVALKYWAKGYAVICPHKNTALLDGALPDDVWLKGDITLMLLCDVVVVCGDWGASAGSINEIKAAKAAGMEIIYG